MWVNISSGNGLLPDGTKPLPELMLSIQFWDSEAFTWKQFYSVCPILYNELNENYAFKITARSPRGKWVNIFSLNSWQFHLRLGSDELNQLFPLQGHSHQRQCKPELHVCFLWTALHPAITPQIARENAQWTTHWWQWGGRDGWGNKHRYSWRLHPIHIHLN